MRFARTKLLVFEGAGPGTLTAPKTQVTHGAPGGAGNRRHIAEAQNIITLKHRSPLLRFKRGRPHARVNEGFTLEGNLALRVC
eukprot:COSAG03_NODE_425_length_8018_cov_3.175906_4_plen_83_part_00